MARSHRAPAVVLGAIVLIACGNAPPKVQAPPPAPVSAPVKTPAPDASRAYWEEVDVKLAPIDAPKVLPLRDERITRTDGANARWLTAPESLREQIRAYGFAVLPSEHVAPDRLGAYYADLARAHVPVLVTVDSLFMLVHEARDRVLADIESRVFAPAAAVLLDRLDKRLTAEGRNAGSDLVPAYATARGIIAVARALASDTYVVAPDLATDVAEDVASVREHTAIKASAVLGIPIDFRAFSTADSASAQTMTWLAEAPLVLASNDEARGAAVDLTRVRTHARAALLIARLLTKDVDPEGSRALNQITRVTRFLGGDADDVSPMELIDLAGRAGLDVRDAGAIANVAKLDHMRHALLAERAPKIYDGEPNVTAHTSSADAGTYVRASIAMRLSPPRGTPDSRALARLVAPTVRSRTFPSVLDVAAWLGSHEARELSREIVRVDLQGDSSEYDTALDAAATLRPADPIARHASSYDSSLEAIAAFLAPSRADATQPAFTSAPWRARRVDAASSAWTTLRYDMNPFARSTPLATPLAAENAPAPPLAFVEPAPETIAALLGSVRQLAHALRDLHALADEAASFAILARADEALALALDVAVRETNDEPLVPSEYAPIATIPAALDPWITPAERSVTHAIPVHFAASSELLLIEATGAIDDLYVAFREPKSGRIVLAIGASIANYEVEAPIAEPLLDPRWRSWLASSNPPSRPRFTSTYVIEPPRSTK